MYWLTHHARGFFVTIVTRLSWISLAFPGNFWSISSDKSLSEYLIVNVLIAVLSSELWLTGRSTVVRHLIESLTWQV